MEPAASPFPDIFAPEAFRARAHQVTDMLAEHLERMARRENPVLPATTPDQNLQAWPADFPTKGIADPMALLDRAITASEHVHHPRCMGHQVTAPAPWSALVDFVGALLNNSSAVYETGPASTAMERACVRWFAQRIGFDPQQADGFFTHGGSAGNLTALLAARQQHAPYDVWEEGVKAEAGLVIVCSDQTHYSARRSAQIMGLGGRNVIVVPTDERFRMRAGALEQALKKAKTDGKIVLAVAASAGSTATGAIDPIWDIADLCEEQGVWLHVDGAHGGAAVVSDTLREELRGIERADSVVIDAHKMLLMPALATLVIFRNGDHSFETFSQNASYIFDGQDPRETWFDLAQRTLECTKRMIGLQVYASLQIMGTDFYAWYVERMYELSRRFAELVSARSHWELATVPESNIVCFRYAPPHMDDVDAFQVRVRESILREGSFYLVKTQLRGKTYLRTTLINPRTELSDLEALLERVETEA